MSVRKGRRFAWWVGATTAAVVGAQQAWVSPSNFQGFDEWLAIELTSRGVIGVPYANRPLVFLWQAVAQGIWPDNLRAYWALTSLAFLATGLLTAWMTHRLLPRAPLVVLLCAVFTAAWAPLDWLRLDTTLIAGYAGFTAATVLSLVLFVESWRRRSRMLLLCSGAVALICALGTESVVPVLAVAPALLLAGSGLRRALADRGRFVRWLAVWTGFVLSAALFAAAPTLAGFRSYQTGALKFDPVPVHVLARLVRLLAMQLTPAVASASHELLHPAVWLAVLGFTVGALVACRIAARATGSVRGRDAASAVALGLLLACAGHLGLALSASVRDPARSQLLSAPGVGLALAGVVAWVGGGLGRTLSRVASARLGAVLPRLGALTLAVWIVAVGTGRVIAMQREWDTGRNAFPAQASALAGLVRAAPALKPNTLVILLDGADAGFMLDFTFRHAVALLYPGQAIGLVQDSERFLYPWVRLRGGVAVLPWPVIREPWGERPTFHRWHEIVVVRGGPAGSLVICRDWPSRILGPLPEGARYRPEERIAVAGAQVPARRLLPALR